ncbi:hypothetical protein CUR178_07637 [Leishmania enriettii]|uniref:Ubiquitin-like domain-containing protein n=1 Tax=Leishmania enriettii TaxID=5663 RepID=A0A836HXU9_LEIEN|nr:hypothetical protein CUR178_07637 [Leishmania enriettii]
MESSVAVDSRSVAKPEKLAAVVAPSATSSSRTSSPFPAAQALTPSRALASEQNEKIRAILRHGSPRTRGFHSISPMAPDASRAPPVELQGPPRYLRARGLTPSPSAAAASRCKFREQQQPERDKRRRRSSSQRRGDRRRSSHDRHEKGEQGVAQAAPLPQVQPPNAISNGSQSQKMDATTAMPHLVASSQPSVLPPSLPEDHQSHCPCDGQHSNTAQQESQRQDCASQSEEWRGAVAQDKERPAREPPPRSRSPASRRASSLYSHSGHAVEGMVLAVPQLSPAQATADHTRHPLEPAAVSFSISARPPRGWRTGEGSSHGVPLQSAAGKQHQRHSLLDHSQRPPQAGASGRFGVPGKDATAEAAPSAARRAAALRSSTPLVGASPIACSYVTQSFSSYLPGESTVMLGAPHRRCPAPSCASPSLPLSSSQAIGLNAGAAAPTSMLVVGIVVAVVAAAAPSLPEPEVLERYEDMLRYWHGGSSCGGSAGEPRHNGGDAQEMAPQRYTDEDLCAAFNLVVHIRLANAEAATVSDIKGEVERRTGLPAAQQCLVYDAMSLQNCLPVHMLLLALGEDNNCSEASERGLKCHSDGIVGGGRDVVMEGRAGNNCLRLVCVPLSSHSAATMAQQTRPIGSPPRAMASLTAATDGRGDSETAALRSRRLMPHASPKTRAASVAAAASRTSPPRRPGARPFTLSHGTTAAASAISLASKATASASPMTAGSNMEQVVSEHINRLRRLYLGDAEISNEWSTGGSASAVAGMRRAPEHADPLRTAASAAGAENNRIRFGLPSVATLDPSHYTPPRPAYRSAVMNGSNSDPTILLGSLPHGAVLSEALIAALPAPPVRRPAPLPPNEVASVIAGSGGTCVPHTSIGALSCNPSELQTQPKPQAKQPTPTTASSRVGANDSDGNSGNGDGGVDASWISSLSTSSSPAVAAAGAMSMMMSLPPSGAYRR